MYLSDQETQRRLIKLYKKRGYRGVKFITKQRDPKNYEDDIRRGFFFILEHPRLLKYEYYEEPAVPYKCVHIYPYHPWKKSKLKQARRHVRRYNKNTENESMNYSSYKKMIDSWSWC